MKAYRAQYIFTHIINKFRLICNR